MSTAEGLGKLRPVMPDGTVTFGGQTHPADGSAAIVVATPEKCREMSSDSNVRIGILGFGLARAELAHMPEATIPAAKQALDQAGLAIKDMAAVKSHNPFAVNDIIFARETGADLMAMNNYGCSLIWGHPQGPTGLALDHRADRGTGHPRRRPRPVPGLRRRRYGDGGGDRRRYAQALTRLEDRG